MVNDAPTEWYPLELRWNAQGILQQRWQCVVISYDASLCEIRHLKDEWRDVPREGP